MDCFFGTSVLFFFFFVLLCVQGDVFTVSVIQDHFGVLVFIVCGWVFWLLFVMVVGFVLLMLGKLVLI